MMLTLSKYMLYYSSKIEDFYAITYYALACFLSGESGVFVRCFASIESAPASTDFLTSNNVLNRQHGYEQYLPGNMNSCRQYWLDVYGYDCMSGPGNTDCGANDSDGLTMVELRTEYGNKIFPLSVLAL